MKRIPHTVNFSSGKSLCAVAFAASLLSACGGGDAPVASSQMATPLASATTTLQIDLATLPEAVALQVAQPMFHMAPVLLDEPQDADSDSVSGSAPHQQAVPQEFDGLSTQRLTVRTLRTARQLRASNPVEPAVDGTAVTVAPMATGTVVSTYSPAQIRAAYGLPALPVAGSALSVAQAAQLGAGQTIYIVDAQHDPNVVAELAAFNQKFGLPTCSTKTIAITAALPLAAPSASACEFSIVYNNAAGAMVSSAPAYNAGWATEITLDVQWAHATAPLARIVLIEAPDATLNSLLGSVKLANAMGPGIVSMSFGSTEGNWTASVDSAFAGANMSYLAATGDSGAAVSWPAVSPKVLAVGGTTLSYSGAGIRSEVSWSGTGGGTSAYTPTPSYQSSAVPGMGAVARRTVADVAFNADPASGQYVAVMAQGSTAVSWLSAGGTSLSTPQWAGLIAVANATRALSAKPALGAAHAVLYGQIAAVPGTYASAFADITKGSDGTCLTCSAKLGYDPLSGLGTPNVAALLNSLSGATAVATAPVVTGAAISGAVGTALSFTASVIAPNAVAYSLSGAPAGMAIASTGVVTWPTPVAGSYAVTVIAKDSKTGLSGQGVYSVTIAAPKAPTVSSATISGKAGVALSFTASVTAPNAVAYSLSGAPAGMAIASTGVVTWPTPVAGSFAVTVIAKDSKTGLSGQGVYSVTIAAPQAPTVASAIVNGKPGVALSFSVGVSATNPVSYTLTGAPAGMSVSSAGLVSWAAPVLGSYAVTVTVKDSKTGLSGQGVYTVKIAAVGPVITAAAMNGVLGKALSGTIAISDPGATSLSISISGAPLGMSFSISGMTLTANWPSPVLGSYSLKVSVQDSAGLSAQAVVPISIAAR